jgi:hypothetical protein
VVDVVCLGILVADVITRPIDELAHGVIRAMAKAPGRAAEAMVTTAR